MKKLHFLVACAVSTTALTASAESKPQQTSTDRIRVIAADDLFQRDVVSSDGQHIGNVEYVMIRTDDGKIDHVVISTEEDKLVTVPFEVFGDQVTGRELRLDTTVDKFGKAPTITEEEITTLTQPTVIEKVEMYWVPVGTERPGEMPKTQTPPEGEPEPQTGTDVKEKPRTTPEKATDETPRYQGTPEGAEPKTGEEHEAHRREGSPQIGGSAQMGGSPQTGTPQTGETAETEGQMYILLAEHDYRVLKPNVTTAEAIDGMEVYTRDGAQIGEVEEVVIDLDNGYVAYTLVGRGGFIGLGMNYVAVPIQAMEYTDAEKLQLKIPARTFKNMRGYVDDDVPRTVRIADLERVYKQFKVTPYFKQKKEEVATR